MAKKIEIEVESEVFTADLLEVEAPRTCKKVLDLLPLESWTKHAIWSGYLLNAVILDDQHKVVPTDKLYFEPEHLTTHPSRGDMVVASFPGPVEISSSVSYDLSGGFSEFFMIYGMANLQWPAGPMPCNHFARMQQQQLDDFAKLGTRVSKEGWKRIVFREKRG